MIGIAARTILVILTVCLTPNAILVAQELSRETLGEQCYSLIHDKSSSASEQQLSACLERAKGVPILVVTPTRKITEIAKTAASVSVVGTEELERSSATSVAEALGDLPGVEVSDAGQSGLQRIRIRGEESRRAAILLDGQEFSDEREVGTPLLIAPEAIERIEVVRGTGSILHGSRAIGGVVNIITKKGGHHPIQGTTSVLVDSGTNGHQLYGSVFGAKDDIGYRVSGTTTENKDRESSNTDIENTGNENRSFSAFLGRRRKNSELGISADSFRGSSEVFVDERTRTTPPFEDFRIEAPQRDRSKVAFFLDEEEPFSGLDRLHFDIYFQESKRQFDTFSDVRSETKQGDELVTTSIFTDSTLDSIGTNLQFDFSLGENQSFVSGLEAKLDSLEQSRLRNQSTADDLARLSESSFDDAEQETAEVYLQDRIELTPDFTLVAGARVYAIRTELEDSSRDYLKTGSNSDSNLVLASSLEYAGFDESLIWLGWSQGFFYPTVINLGTGAFAGPNFINPNENLDAETSDSFEIGSRVYRNKWTLESSVFYVESDDYIDDIACSQGNVRCPAVAGPRDRIYSNIASATTFGIELLAKYQLASWLSPYGTATWLRRKLNDGELDTYDSGQPKLSSRLGVEVELNSNPQARQWFDSYLRLATDSDEFVNPNRTDHRSGWGTLNLAFGTELGPKRDLRFILDAQNILNQDYIPAYSNIPGRGTSFIFKLVSDFS